MQHFLHKPTCLYVNSRQIVWSLLMSTLITLKSIAFNIAAIPQGPESIYFRKWKRDLKYVCNQFFNLPVRFRPQNLRMIISTGSFYWSLITLFYIATVLRYYGAMVLGATALLATTPCVRHDCATSYDDSNFKNTS